MSHASGQVGASVVVQDFAQLAVFVSQAGESQMVLAATTLPRSEPPARITVEARSPPFAHFMPSHNLYLTCAHTTSVLLALVLTPFQIGLGAHHALLAVFVFFSLSIAFRFSSLSMLTNTS